MIGIPVASKELYVYSVVSKVVVSMVLLQVDEEKQ